MGKDKRFMGWTIERPIMGTSTFFKYPPGFEFKGLKVLNLGCGSAQYEAENVTNLDAFEICKPDVVHDLEKMPLPFEAETFDLVIANHILEHLHNWWACFNECARILKKNGILEVWSPAMSSDSLFAFRDHVSVVSESGFYGIANLKRPATNAWAETQNETAIPANDLVMVKKQRRFFNYWWVRKAPEKLRQWMGNHLRNIVAEEGYAIKKV
jgi:SAM-dependent methyltransferase